MSRRDGQDPTHATRQARYRARQAARQDEAVHAAVQAAVPVLAELVADRVMARLVPFLGASRDASADSADSARPVDNRRASRTRGVDKVSRDASADSADSVRHVTPPDMSRARARGEAAPAPYGGQGAATYDVEDDWWTLARIMAGAGRNSAGGIRDALGATGLEWTLARVSQALVHGMTRGEARRHPGDGSRRHPFDLWELVAPPPAAPVPPLQVDAAPEVHVTCQDYQAHATHHQWDPDRGAFRCALCDPVPAPGQVVPPPPGPGAPSVTH